MAGFGVAFVIPMLLLLPHGAVGASLSASEKLMRREAKPSRVMDRLSVTPGGELVQSKPKKKVGTADYCDADFKLGIVGTNDCAITTGLHGVNHHLITSEGMCKQAATEAGGLTQGNMKIAGDYENLRPKGCFQQPCSEADPYAGDTGVCYFFNGNLNTPGSGGATIVGTPVCHRAVYLNYVAPDTDTGDAGCPVGYSLIPTEGPCRQVQNCLGDAPGEEFQVGKQNASQHFDYPLGCFIDQYDNEIYVNEASAMDARRATVTGTVPRLGGTLICTVIVSSRAAANYTWLGGTVPLYVPGTSDVGLGGWNPDGYTTTAAPTDRRRR